MIFKKKKTPREQKTINFDGIGEVHFKRSQRARNISIRIKPFAGVRVTVPNSVSFSRAEGFVESKRSWLEKHLKRVSELEQKSLIYDGSREITTRHHRLQVLPWDKDKISTQIRNGIAIVRYPQDQEVTVESVQNAIRKILTETLRREAKDYLPSRTHELAEAYGFKLKQVFIKNHRSRWGSCSQVNNINLSLHLMRLPDDLIDYVILHELIHTEIKNHSAEFWKRVGEVCPDYERLRKKLRKFEFSFIL